MEKDININIIDTKNLLSMALWAFLLCIAWFGHFNNWWPAAFAITFTAIVGSLYALHLIITIVSIVVAIRNN